MKLFIIMWVATAVFTTTGDWKCGGGGGSADGDSSDTSLVFDCEYDYVNNIGEFGGTNCDVFPYGASVCRSAFAAANTNFSRTYPQVINTGQYPINSIDLIDIAHDHADWADLNTESLEHQLYLVSVNRFDQSNLLGHSLRMGLAHRAICVMYYEAIRDIANSNGLSASDLANGAVIHELGHGRASLSHLCGDSAASHDPPRATFTCIMADTLPHPGWPCWVQGQHKLPLDNIGFCSECQKRLLQVSW